MSVQPAKSAPERIVLEGKYVLLEPVAAQHAAGLFAISEGEEAAARYRWLPNNPPKTLGEVEDWIASVQDGSDRYVVVIERKTGRVVGRQGWLRVRPEHGSIEIGGIYWGLPMARSRLATEAFHLFARHAFNDLGYRRFEWKCNDLNAPSKAAALRFGFTFEGVFRQDMIVKGESRDTAWFSILDHEWRVLDPHYERWMNENNFDAEGKQRTRLATR